MLDQPPDKTQQCISMQVLLFGGTGGCGSQALVRLLQRGIEVTVIVRSEVRIPDSVKGHKLLTVVLAPGGHLCMDRSELMELLRPCSHVISCLGHRLTFKGMCGSPRTLCTDTVRLICELTQQLGPASPLRLIVVNTEGCDRLDGADPRRGCGERLLLSCLWCCLPPHRDNVGVMHYLSRKASSNSAIEFCAVRPSDMIDDEGCEFTLHETLQNGIFNAGTTRRANVGAFMADLVTKSNLWETWKNKFPHILDVVVSPLAERKFK